ncbi:MAG: shikimate dehydrogenase [Gammaproteobacteria bacterium]|nr:shikimate dehydrogenase [Gammaproteobacteria bacterium]MBU1645174.1 shikimate dehydrogenase [Gammaproteobacteria bacterium]MBU1973411.1 shikimate dehydrogenase [Gammaproteobacteria bacterium]
MTDRYAVFGNPIGHSKSPRIHALFAQQTGQDMDYAAILASVDGFAASIRDFVAGGGRGANVTVPFKEEAFRLATELTPRAQAAGAVNTLSFDSGRIRGDNTDGAGLVRDIAANRGATIAGSRVLILGAGGAARGVILPLLEQQPAAVFVANRTAEKAAGLATTFAVGGGGFDALAGRAFDLVINATSAGLADAALPLPAAVFAPGCLAYEMLYGRDTPFMAQASAAGATVADGLGMLVEQAAEAFFVWRGVRPDTAPVLAELRQG